MTEQAPFAFSLCMNLDRSKLPLDGTVIAQPKYDGFRVAIVPSRLAQDKVDARLGRSVATRTYTRAGGYVPNDFARELLDALPIGLDGELIATDCSATGEADFAETMSSLRRKAGRPEFAYVVYDYDNGSEDAYSVRMAKASALLAARFPARLPEWLKLVPTVATVRSLEDIDSAIVYCADLGYEGAIFRRTDVPPLRRRAYSKQPWLMRAKEWADAEFEIVDVIEEVWHDCATNRAERPGLIGEGKGFAASFVCAPAHGFTEQFRAPLACTVADAKDYWRNRGDYIGQLAKVRWLKAGCVSRPRLPVCLGVRPEFDLPAETGQKELCQTKAA